MSEAPRYQHDCSYCVFLGRFKEFDLYFCGPKLHPTVIARFGDDGPEYQSGWGAQLEELEEARKRAREKGLI